MREPLLDESATEEFPNLEHLEAVLRRIDTSFATYKHSPNGIKELCNRASVAFEEVGAVVLNYHKTRKSMPLRSFKVYVSWINLSGSLANLRSLAKSDLNALGAVLGLTSEILTNAKTARASAVLSNYFTAGALEGSGGAAALHRFVRQPSRTFDDIVGMDKEKAEVMRIVRLAKLGLSDEGYNSFLLYGPPGTGKTAFAEAAAHFMRAKYVLLTTANVFKPQLGESETLLKDIFEGAAAERERVFIFIDEIDTLTGRGEGQLELKASITATLLNYVNPKSLGENVFFAAATNFPRQLDEALVRGLLPKIKVALPDRRAICDHLTRLLNFLDLSFAAELAKHMEKSRYSFANVETVVKHLLIEVKGLCTEPGSYLPGTRGYPLKNLGHNDKSTGLCRVSSLAPPPPGAIFLSQEAILKQNETYVYLPENGELVSAFHRAMRGVKAVTMESYNTSLFPDDIGT